MDESRMIAQSMNLVAFSSRSDLTKKKRLLLDHIVFGVGSHPFRTLHGEPLLVTGKHSGGYLWPESEELPQSGSCFSPSAPKRIELSSEKGADGSGVGACHSLRDGLILREDIAVCRILVR